MSKVKNSLKAAVFLIPLMLGACGDGWEAVYTKDIFPYGNERTAGIGVVYVRQVMMPEKTLSVTEHMAKETLIEAEEKREEVRSKMNKAFQAAQSK